MADCLKDFTFEEFTQMKSQWMKSGRLVWSLFGNIDNKTAIKIVDECRGYLNIKATAKTDLPANNNICIPNGTECKI